MKIAPLAEVKARFSSYVEEREESPRCGDKERPAESRTGSGAQ